MYAARPVRQVPRESLNTLTAHLSRSRSSLLTSHMASISSGPAPVRSLQDPSPGSHRISLFASTTLHTAPDSYIYLDSLSSRFSPLAHCASTRFDFRVISVSSGFAHGPSRRRIHFSTCSPSISALPRHHLFVEVVGGPGISAEYVYLIKLVTSCSLSYYKLGMSLFQARLKCEIS